MKLLRKYHNMAIQAKASLWYTVCNFFQKGISFIVVPVYVRLLSTAEYGEWSVFQSWRDILIIFASLNLYCGVYTKTLVDNTDDRDRYTASMQGLGTLISIGLFIVYIFTHEWCNAKLELNTFYMSLLFLYFIVHPGLAFWTSRQRVEYKYQKMVAVTVIMSVLTPSLSVILLKCTELREKALILGFLLVQCGFGLFFYVYQFLKGKCFYHKEYWKYAAKFNISLVPHYLSFIILNQSDRIMIKEICDESDAGIYSFAYQIASAINVLISAINGSRVPWTYEKLKSKTYDSLKQTTNALVIMMGAITVLVALISPEIISILGTEDYSVAVYVIPIVTLGVYYTFVYDLYASIEFYYGATKYVMYASIIGAILNLLLNFIFIPMYGFIAAAYTTLICYVVFMFMHYLFSKIVLRNEGIQICIYDNRTIMLLSALATMISLVCMVSFKCNIIRLLLILSVMIVCYLKRKNIIELLKSIK